MIWATVSSFFVGSVVTLKGRIIGEKYREILPGQVHPMMQTLFPTGDVFNTKPILSTGISPRTFSLVVKVTDSWLVCHELKPSTAEDPPCRGDRCMLNMSRLKCPPVDVAWKLGKEMLALVLFLSIDPS
ncbi:hypothetical protein TNCV_5006841 [Trichonephila clavipes]|nr:hypothetical protein TNCV_5006841 [Trichonephila clavipes]